MAAINEETQRIINRICANDETLTKAFLRGKYLGDEGARQVALALTTNTYLTYLDLSENYIGNEGLNYLTDAITNNKNIALSHLNISGNDFNGSEKIFARLFKNNTSLKKLDFRGRYNLIGYCSRINDQKEIFEALLSNHSLENLNFTGAFSEYDDYLTLANFLINNKTLLKFSLNVKLNDEHFEIINKAIELNESLQKITIKPFFALKKSTVNSLIEAINANPKIKTFQLLSDVSQPVKPDASIKVFNPKFYKLVKYNNLVSLSLSMCEFDKKTIKMFSKYLMNNKSLKKLELFKCIKPGFIKYLADALSKNKTLLQLLLPYNKFLDKDLKALASGLKINNTLELLDVSSCDIDDAGLEHICNILKVNKSLKLLRLEQINILNEGLKLLAKSLTNNNTLRYIRINVDHINFHAVDEVNTLLSINRALLVITFRFFIFPSTEYFSTIKNKLDKIDETCAKNHLRVISQFLMKPEICEIPWNISLLKDIFVEENKLIAKISGMVQFEKILCKTINKVNMCLFSYAANKNTPQGFPIELITKIGDYVFEDEQGMSDMMIARCNKYAGIGFSRRQSYPLD